MKKINFKNISVKTCDCKYYQYDSRVKQNKQPTEESEMESYEIYKNLDIEDMQGEIWKHCDENKQMVYEVSNMGRIKSTDKRNGKSKIKKQAIHAIEKRLLVGLANNKTHWVARVVAEAFIPNLENKPTVNHINIDNLTPEQNKLDNRVVNLEFATRLEQMEHAWRTGLITAEKLSTPVVVLDTNGLFISEHSSFKDVLNNCDGLLKRYNEKTVIKGNTIVMHKDYYEELSEDEIFIIATHCFELMLSQMYEIDGVAVDNSLIATEMLNCSRQNLHEQTSHKFTANIKGKNVSRLIKRMTVTQEKSKEEHIYEQITIK